MDRTLVVTVALRFALCNSTYFTPYDGCIAPCALQPPFTLHITPVALHSILCNLTFYSNRRLACNLPYALLFATLPSIRAHDQADTTATHAAMQASLHRAISPPAFFGPRTGQSRPIELSSPKVLGFTLYTMRLTCYRPRTTSRRRRDNP